MDDDTTCAPLDTEVAEELAAIPIDIGQLLGGLTDDNVAAVRETMGQMPVPELGDGVERTDHEVPGSGVSRSASTDRRASTGDLPCVYWMHGGGLVIGSYEGDDARFDRWCPLFGCVGV